MTAGLRRWSWELALPVALVLGYHLWATHASELYFPPVPAVLEAFVQTWTGRGLVEDVRPSLVHLAAGYTLGLALGVAAGVGLGLLRRLREAVSPVVSFVLTLPPVALLPVFLLVLGVGSQLQIGIVTFAVYLLVMVSTADAVRRIDATLLDVTRTFRLGRRRRVLEVVVPAAAPAIVGAARAALSVAILVMVVSEMVGASHGIGAATLLGQQSFRYAQMWAGMLLLAVLGYGLNALFALAERPVLRRYGLTTTSRRTSS